MNDLAILALIAAQTVLALDGLPIASRLELAAYWIDMALTLSGQENSPKRGRAKGEKQ